MRSLLALAVSSSLLLLARPAAACSVCACGDPLADSAEQAPRPDALRAALEAEYLTVESGSEAAEGARTTLEQYTVRAVGVWSPTGALNLALTVPLVAKSLADSGGGLGHVHGPEHLGLGDVEVGGRLFLLNGLDLRRRTRQTLAVSAGTSMPTGANDLRDRGERVDEHGQLGTGGWGPYAGVAWRLQGDAWGAQASLAGRYRTRNAHSYRYGEALLWSTGGEWRPATRFAVTMNVDGRLAARDRAAEGFEPHTGGLVLAAAPGIHADAGGGVWLSLRGQIPAYSHLYGVQRVGPTVVAGVQYDVF